MKAMHFVLSAVLLAFGGAANAANRDVTEYLQRAGAVARDRKSVV